VNSTHRERQAQLRLVSSCVLRVDFPPTISRYSKTREGKKKQPTRTKSVLVGRRTSNCATRPGHDHGRARTCDLLLPCGIAMGVSGSITCLYSVASTQLPLLIAPQKLAQQLTAIVHHINYNHDDDTIPRVLVGVDGRRCFSSSPVRHVDGGRFPCKFGLTLFFAFESSP
jgi:hypothetical protein